MGGLDHGSLKSLPWTSLPSTQELLHEILDLQGMNSLETTIKDLGQEETLDVI